MNFEVILIIKKHSHSFFDPSLMMSEWRGFDIVIWNPPYIKEYDNRNAFNWLRDKPYYIWKMDLWYYFACYWLDLLKDWWIQSFIAQNNWITSFGAKIMRNKLLEDSKIKEFIDFWDFKVFENVWIQTMIYILEKTKSNLKYEVKYSKLENKDFDRKKIDLFLVDSKNTTDYKKHFSKIEKYKYLDKTIDFVDDEKDSILEKIFEKWNFKFTEKEVAQWIQWAPDEPYLVGNINIFSEEEKKYLKKHYTNNFRYYKWLSQNYIIYLRESNFSWKNIQDFPNIFKHFLPNISILKEARIKLETPNKPYYYLHRERDENFFSFWEKIVFSSRVNKPSFLYTIEEYYWSRVLYYIKTDRINYKYITWLLNSSLIEFWLKNKWKLVWDMYQIDKGHFLNIPLIEANEDKQKEIIFLVDEILKITNTAWYNPKDIPEKQQDLEDKIDEIVYELYWLEKEDIDVIEESLEK